MEMSDWLELVWLPDQVFGLVFFPGHYLDGFCGRRGLVTVDDLAIPIFRTFSPVRLNTQTNPNEPKRSYNSQTKAKTHPNEVTRGKSES